VARSSLSLTPGSWLHLPGRTARAGLTLLYAGMFLLLGTGLIAIIYVLASSGSPIRLGRSAPAAAFARGVNAPVVPAAAPRAGAGVAVVVRQHSADLQRLLGVSWLVLAITAVAAALLGWLASGRVLRPLREMTATARTISAGNLGERLALVGPEDEFKQLDTALASAPATGDPGLVERLTANLIDNAVGYSGTGGRVEIRTVAAAGVAVLSVANSGPVVPPGRARAAVRAVPAARRRPRRRG
jgi:methyl-accepting chemotaxis protein